MSRYDELPVAANGLRCAWAEFGPGDQRGTVNRLTDEVVAAAVAEVRTGQRVNISLPLTEPDPPFFGRKSYRHTITPMIPYLLDDVLDQFYPQCSTQWDGLRHRGDPTVGYYGGVSAEDASGLDGKLGIGVWAGTGLTGRGVLADLDLPDPLDRHPVTPDDIEQALARQGTETRPGDILLVRTGYLSRYLPAPPDERVRLRDSDTCAGLAASEAMAAYLWDKGFAAVAVDNPTGEVSPRDPAVPSLHSRLIPMLGFALGELFDLDELARVSAADGRYSCLVVSVPLNLPAGVGSPANAIAVR
ncbi:MAG TPA: cyclase family protein [Pseudonocardiaceae bacterium]|nr:cyclase family protein [Pseudonocardiaceae bacterium]